jgi:hypothetical protein
MVEQILTRSFVPFDSEAAASMSSASHSCLIEHLLRGVFTMHILHRQPRALVSIQEAVGVLLVTALVPLKRSR